MASFMAAKITALLGSDARLVICKFEGAILIVTLLKELVEPLGISAKVVNEAGFHTPRIRPVSPGIHR